MLNPNQVQLASAAVRELRVALSNFFLYAAGNAMVQQSLERFLRGLDLLFENLPSVALGESEGRLVVEGTPLDERYTGSTNMIRDLLITHQVHSLSFLKGIQAEEIKVFFSLLKPHALPGGTSISQALGKKPLPHILLNEKVYVAIKDNEKVVSALNAGDGGGDGDLEGENLQEALEALQYFLQVFSKVRPDSNKREVARKMIDNMGGWLKPESSPSGSTPGSFGMEGLPSWKELMSGFLDLKQTLASIRQPAEAQGAQASLEELLKKLVLLGEGQDAHATDMVRSPASGEGVIPAAEESGLVPVPVAEVDSILGAIDSGKLDALWDPEKEHEVDSLLAHLQEPEEMDVFESVWEAFWKKIFLGDEKIQGLCLRHLNRLQWNAVPRHIQLDGFRNLRKFLDQRRNPANYLLGLSLIQNWLPLEVSHPNWDELLETVKTLRELEKKSPPLFERQNQAVRVALDTVFCVPILEQFYAKSFSEEKDPEHLAGLFVILHEWVGPFLFEKIDSSRVGSPDWEKAVDWLNVLEWHGVAVYKSWLKENKDMEKLGRFLEIFRKVPLTSNWADYFEGNWKSFSPDLQKKVLEVIVLWKRTDFRPLLIDLLNSPDLDLSGLALKGLGKMGIDGDAPKIVEAVRKMPLHTKERDHFWVKACETLGEMADPQSIEALTEWAEKYKFLESKKERSLEVRRAAIQALGHFKSRNAEAFLLALEKEGEKELKPVVSQSLKSVVDRLKLGTEAEK